MRCEDFPCCGHEMGDCDGSLYGSDESIKARVLEDIRTGHGDCDHEAGIYHCENQEDDECFDEEHACTDCDKKSGGWQCHWCERPCPQGSHDDPMPQPGDVIGRRGPNGEMLIETYGEETPAPALSLDISERWYPR